MIVVERQRAFGGEGAIDRIFAGTAAGAVGEAKDIREGRAGELFGGTAEKAGGGGVGEKNLAA